MNVTLRLCGFSVRDCFLSRSGLVGCCESFWWCSFVLPFCPGCSILHVLSLCSLTDPSEWNECGGRVKVRHFLLTPSAVQHEVTTSKSRTCTDTRMHARALPSVSCCNGTRLSLRIHNVMGPPRRQWSALPSFLQCVTLYWDYNKLQQVSIIYWLIFLFFLLMQKSRCY